MSNTKKNVVFVFSGAGSQWPEMGAGLGQYAPFASAIHQCDKILGESGVDWAGSDGITDLPAKTEASQL